MPAPIIKFRKYQEVVFWKKVRRLLLMWARQRGKSFTLASKALSRMMQRRDHSCIFVSASILLGSEFVRKEAQVWNTVLAKFKEICASQSLRLETNVDGLDLDAISDVFEHQKLEAKIWHDRTTCSRSIVVAPNPATAVGWTGDIFMDEVGRIFDLKDVIEAVQPFMSSNPEFIWWQATTPPPDDMHYSFEMFLPPIEEFKVNPIGNWYTSKSGIPCHRVDAWDGADAGVPLYDDDTGDPCTPEEHRKRAYDKIAWDRNYGLRFVRGGISAVSFAAIARAMEMGKGQCMGIDVREAITR